MRMKQIKKSLSLIFCMMLIVAMALFTNGCSGKEAEAPAAQETETSVVVEETTQEVEGTEQKKGVQTKEMEVSEKEVTVLGEGENKFLFTVVDKDEVETAFEIHTDQETVGDALQELDLIAGDEGEFGLFVKTVNGIAADYDVDGTYWAFYVDGEYAVSGVDTTTIEEGISYMFKVEK